MTPTRKKRLILVALVAMGVALSAAIFLTAFKDNIMYFKSPSEVAAQDFPVGRNFRLGGMVKEASLNRVPDTLKVRFKVTDFSHDVEVEYEGILPDLFREGQGVVTIGKMQSKGLFVAEEVLAKHDENYMPPEAAAALEQAAEKRQQENP